MKCTSIILLTSWVCACTPEMSEIRWALDRIELEPDENAGLVGTQTWELFDARWEKSQSENHRVCTVYTDLLGQPTDSPACARCTFAWDITAVIADHDCDASIIGSIDVLEGMTGVALGEIAPRLVPA